MKETGKVVLSIPYEKGWSVYLIGKKIETGLFGDTLMTFTLTPGFYEIEMNYVPQGKYIGIVVSLISLLIFGSIIVGTVLRRKS